jgi:hypothetical protein
MNEACSPNMVGLSQVTLFFFPFIYISYLDKYTMVLMVIDISDSVLLVMIFVIFPFVQVLFIFNLTLSF